MSFFFLAVVNCTQLMHLCFQVPAGWKHGEAGSPPWEGVPVLWGGRVWPHRVWVSPEHAEGWQLHPSGRPSPSCLALWAFLRRGQHVHRCSRWVGQVWIFSLFIFNLTNYLKMWELSVCFQNAVLVVCVLSYLTTYHIGNILRMEVWVLASLSVGLLVFSGCVYMVCRQPQTTKKVSFMVRGSSTSPKFSCQVLQNENDSI